MKRAKRRKFVNKWALYDLCGVPRAWHKEVEAAAASIAAEIDAEIVRKITGSKMIKRTGHNFGKDIEFNL